MKLRCDRARSFSNTRNRTERGSQFSNLCRCCYIFYFILLFTLINCSARGRNLLIVIKMNFYHKTYLTALVLLSILSYAAAYKYLFILHMAAQSHYNVGSALAKGLASAGHEVTLVSPFPLKKPIKNIIDMPLPEIVKAIESEKSNLFETAKKPIFEAVINFHKMGLKITDSLLKSTDIQSLLKSNQTFDAVICEVFLNEAHYGLAEHYNVPLIGFSTFGAIAWNTDMVGSPSPPSYVPSALLRFSDHMTLLQRIANLAFVTYERLFLDLWYLPQQQKLYEKYFPNNKRDMYEVRRNAALVLLNQHVSLSFPRPYSPNMIEVGGMHINRKRTPLPADIEKFIVESKHGVIYFSMGSNLKSKDLPIEMRNEILKALGSLKQRVLWKFEDTKLKNKPANVFISDWYPQDDILAHPNVLAFITHGGLLSTTESIYHGKPFVGIPVFGDQFLNMARAEEMGYGISVDFLTLTAEKLKNAIERIINDPSYGKLVQDMSTRYRDQKETPLERAVYWVEHVTRHKGAKYLRSASQDLNFIQYHNLDATLILYGGILVALYLIFYILRFIVGLVKLFLFSKAKKTRKTKIN